MIVAGYMAAYVSLKSNVDMPTARVIVALALEAADDPNFALKFAKDYEWDDALSIYMDVIKFLREMNL